MKDHEERKFALFSVGPGTELRRGKRKDNQTRKGLGSCDLGSLMQRPQPPRSSECLLYTIEWRDRVITHN